MQFVSQRRNLCSEISSGIMTCMFYSSKKFLLNVSVSSRRIKPLLTLTNKSTAILLRKNIEPKSILLNPSGRIASIVFDNINYINIYAHSGTQFRKQRDLLFNEDIIPHVSNEYPNILLGDFNCIIDSSDSNSTVTNFCSGLNNLVLSMGLKDVEKSRNK